MAEFKKTYTDQDIEILKSTVKDPCLGCYHHEDIYKVNYNICDWCPNRHDRKCYERIKTMLKENNISEEYEAINNIICNLLILHRLGMSKEQIDEILEEMEEAINKSDDIRYDMLYPKELFNSQNSEDNDNEKVERCVDAEHLKELGIDVDKVSTLKEESIDIYSKKEKKK